MDKLDDLTRYERVAIDVETTGIDWRTDKIFGVVVSTPVPGDDRYWDIRHHPQVMDWLREMGPRLPHVVNHNIKFDLHMLREAGVHINPAACDCTMNRAALIDEHRLEYSLDSLARDYLGERKYNDIYQELADLYGGSPTRKAQMPNLHRAPPSLVAKYARPDGRLAMRLWEEQERIIEHQGLHQVWALEKRLFPHVVEMERRGIRVDEERAERQIEKLSVRIADLRAQLDATAGFAVNPNPSGSIMRLFAPRQDEKGQWFANDGTPLRTTDAGKPSLGKEALERISHPAAGLILQARKLMKARDTFLRGHVLGHAINGYVHPNINQTKGDETGGTGTGRLSYTGPALQQIPARDKEVASLIRPVFVPDPGQKWSYGDLDQHELRIFVNYAKPKKILDMYRSDPYMDMHQAVADLTGMPRSAQKSGGANAKQINLAMVFNMGGGELADRMSLPWEWESFDTIEDGQPRTITYKKPGPEAVAIMNKYYAMVPGVKEMAKRASAKARRRGYVRTLLGRHIRFPGGKYTHKASGLIYQGGGADLNKLNICLACEYLAAEAPESRVLLNIHDELSMSMVDDGKAEQHLLEIKRLIQDKPQLQVPITIDFSEPSSSWWDATQARQVTHGHSWANNLRCV